MFETDYSTNSSALLPAGKYEFIIKSAHISATQGGTLYFSVRLVVRNDVPQKYQNKNIYHAIWQKKPDKQTEDDRKVDGYSFKQIMNLCEMAGLSSGKSYNTINDMGDDLIGKPVQAEIYHDTWNGKTSEKVKWFYKTNHPDCRHADAEPARPDQSLGSPADIVGQYIDDDGDLPFD